MATAVLIATVLLTATDPKTNSESRIEWDGGAAPISISLIK